MTIAPDDAAAAMQLASSLPNGLPFVISRGLAELTVAIRS
jgi:hypothetical protein